MKVLVIHNTYKIRGGEDTVYEAECNALSASNYSVVQLTFSNDDISGVLRKLCASFNAFFSFPSFLKVWKAIKREKPDIIHIHNLFFKASPSILYAAKFLGVPVVMTLHNFRLICPSGILLHQGRIFEDSLHSFFPWSAIKKKVYRNSFTETLMLASMTTLHKVIRTWNHVDRFIVLTEFAKEKFLQSSLPIQPDKYSVKPNFTTDPGYFLEKDDYYLFVGRLSEEKGLLTLLKAFKSLNRNLKIIGHGPMENEVRSYTHQYPNIEFLGSMKHASLMEYMKTTKALIFPSIWYETFGMVAIEAFACATPVIASNLGAMSELVRNGENGFLFEAGNSESLTRAIINFESDEKKQRDLGITARNDYERMYSPKENVQLLTKIYQDTLHSYYKHSS